MKCFTLRLVAALALLTTAVASLASGSSTGPSSPLDRYVAQISQDLNLSADQEKRIRPVLAASMVATMSALKDRNDNAVPAESKDDPFAEGKAIRNERKLGEEIRDIRTDTQESLEDILTPDQLAKYNRMRDENRTRMQERVRSKRY